MTIEEAIKRMQMYQEDAHRKYENADPYDRMYLQGRLHAFSTGLNVLYQVIPDREHE